MLLQLTISPKVATPHTARATIASLIALKHTMAMLPTIAGALEGAASSLLQAVKTNLSGEMCSCYSLQQVVKTSLLSGEMCICSRREIDSISRLPLVVINIYKYPCPGNLFTATQQLPGTSLYFNINTLCACTLSAPALGSICALVDAVITEDTTWSKSPVQQRQQECFAVRPGTDGNLDAVRKVHVCVCVHLRVCMCTCTFTFTYAFDSSEDLKRMSSSIND